MKNNETYKTAETLKNHTPSEKTHELSSRNAVSPKREDGSSRAGVRNQRVRRISEALECARKDLIAMRKDDHALHLQFLDLGKNLNILKTLTTCNEHADMLDNFSLHLEEVKDLKQNIYVSDLPCQQFTAEATDQLRHVGISTKSFDFKRFSVV